MSLLDIFTSEVPDSPKKKVEKKEEQVTSVVASSPAPVIEQKPIVDNGSDEGTAKNRRTDFEVIH